jgi:hypothetical protein
LLIIELFVRSDRSSECIRRAVSGIGRRWSDRRRRLSALSDQFQRLGGIAADDAIILHQDIRLRAVHHRHPEIEIEPKILRPGMQRLLPFILPVSKAGMLLAKDRHVIVLALENIGQRQHLLAD